MSYLETNGAGQAPPADGPGMFAELCGRIDLSIGAVSDLTRELRRPKKPRPLPAPVFGRVRASGVYPSSGVLALVFDQPGPEQGKFWYARSITVGGVNPTTTANGRADIYVSAMIPAQGITLAALGLADWRDFAATLPDVSFYGRGEFPMRHNENLITVISSGTAGQQYVAVCQFEEYQEGVVGEAWDI